MNRKKRLIALCCVLVVAVGAAVGVSLYTERAEQIAESGEVVFELPVGEVTGLAWEYTNDEDETVSLAFTNDGGWTYDGDAAFPVDGEAITALLERFEALQAAVVIDGVTDYGQYGLDEPLCTISVAAGDTEYEIALGNYSELDYQRYLSLGDGKVYLVNDDPMEYYSLTLDDLMLDDTIPVFTDVTRVEFAGAENYTIERNENGGSYRGDDVYYTDGDVLDTTSVDSYVSLISALELADYYTYDATDDDIAAAGLDEPELTVTIDYPESSEEGAETLTFTIAFSRSAGDKLTDWDEVLEAMEAEEEEAAEETAEPTDEDAVAYLRVGESAIIYEISYDTFKSLMECSYDDLRHTELFPAETEDIASLSVTLDDETYEFTTTAPESGDGEETGEDGAEEDDGDDEIRWYFDGEQTDIADVEAAIANLSVSRFAKDTSSGETEISLSATLTSGDEISLRLYRVDGGSCLATVDGTGVGYVPRSQVVDLIEAVNAIVLG